MVPLTLLVFLVGQSVPPPRVAIDPPTQAAPTLTWSIKSDPYADAPYRADQPCPDASGETVVVCARPNTELRLPLPAERGPPEGPRKSVAYLDGAELPQGTPCGAVQKGCTTGLDLFGSARVLYKVAKKVADPDAD